MKLAFPWLLIALSISAVDAHGQNSSPSSSTPFIEGGLTLHSGAGDNNNLNGSNSAHGALGTVGVRGHLRYYFRTEGSLSSGQIISTDSTLNADLVDLLKVSASAGFWFLPLSSQSLKPLLGAGGIAGWHLIENGTPPTGESISAQGFHYGYELHAGFLFGSLLLRATYVAVSTTYGGASLSLNGIQGSLGWVVGR
jgi:hypothetical protein